MSRLHFHKDKMITYSQEVSNQDLSWALSKYNQNIKNQGYKVPTGSCNVNDLTVQVLFKIQVF